MKRPDPFTRCYICNARVGTRGEWDHFPVPASCGGTHTEPICVGCHDVCDRFTLAQWDAADTVRGLMGAWGAGYDTRIALVKLIKITSQLAAARGGGHESD